MSLEPFRSSDDYSAAYKASVENPELFWADIASHLKWQKPWDKV
jgi:acetyl-CoA synthetase